jgi:cyclopropane fatty-acyl-phospholipid synthase-like methyltransferase
MHALAQQFVRSVVTFPTQGLRVVEFGSYDPAATIRRMFPGCLEYLGLDLRAGENVDRVCDAREFTGIGYDVVVSTEVLEHEKNPQDIIDAMQRALRSGGLAIITAASPPRMPHHTTGPPDLRGEYYSNIPPCWIHEMLSGWQNVVMQYDSTAGDLYATAQKRW